MTNPAPTLDLRPAAESPQPKPAIRSWRRGGRRWALAASALVVVAGAAGGWWLTHQPLTVPRTIAAHVLFPIYLPSFLPPDYTIDPDTYSTRQGVLLFAAKDETGHNLTFSEQAKPQDYDIAAFQAKSLDGAQSLPGSPYPSVIGKTDGGGLLLSIQADNTWVLVSTKSLDARANLEHIAKNLRRL